MPVRVLHIIGSLGLGGAQTSVKYLVENADTENIESFVYPLRPKNIAIPIEGRVLKLHYPNYDPRKFFAILRLCKEHNIDIIHAHLHKPIIAALLATWFCKARVIIHERGPIFRKGFQYSIYRFMLRFLHHRATVIIANSQATAAQLTKKANIEPARIRVIHNAVDFDRFAPNTAFRQQARELLKAGQDDIVIGFAGRLCHVKGPDLLIKAMALLLEKSPKYLLALAGHGPERQNLQTLADSLGICERIRFLGFCDNVNEIMNAFDIAVVPSRQEAFGISLIEFMRTRIPLVCSGVEGMAELVENEVTALVTAENTPAEISRCIERLAGDTVLRKSLADNAYDYCSRFSVSNNVKAIQQVYLEIAYSDKM